MLKKFVMLNVAGALAFVLASSTAGAATYSFVVSGQSPGNLNNDCSGYFGSGFDSCNVKIDGTDLSAVIAKWDNDDWTSASSTLRELDGSGDATGSEINNTTWSSVTGSEFSISVNETPDPDEYTWTYNPGTNDPLIKYWVHKQGPGFTIYWEVASDPTNACTSPMTLACMQLATTITTGTWAGDWSHITWYDSVPSGGSGPQPVPLPAAGFLLLGALGGLGALKRYRRATG